MNKLMKIILPLVILLIAFGAYKWQMAHRPVAKKAERPPVIPMVEVTPVLEQEFRTEVSGYGTVKATRALSLVSEVTGVVVWMNPTLATGGVFKKGETLFRLEKTTYEAAVASAEATLRDAEYNRKKIEEEARIAAKEWDIWNRSGAEKKPSALVSYEPQLASAVAKEKAAEKALDKARSDLGKTVFTAPFDAVIVSETIETGKLVRAAETVAELIGTESFEVTVPIPVKSASELRVDQNKEKASTARVVLTEGDHEWEWAGYVSRILPDADSKTGMLKAVVTLPEPNAGNGKPMLTINSLVESTLYGVDSTRYRVIPEEAFREGSVVWVLNEDMTLGVRKIKTDGMRDGAVLVISGVNAGEKVVVSKMKGAVDGMKVRLAGAKKKPEAEGKPEQKGAQQ